MTRTTKRPAMAPGGPESQVELPAGSEIGRSIRMLRASEGLTQAQLEERTGVHRASISAYETGRLRPRAATYARIMAVAESRPPKTPRRAAVAAAVDALAERVRALAEAAFAEVAARLAAGLPPSLGAVNRPAGESP